MFNKQFRTVIDSKYKYTIAFFLILLGAVLIRFVNLTTETLWYDEIFGIQISYYSASFFDILEYSKETYYTPLYYIMLRWWLLVFENNALYARLLSVIFSMSSLALVYYFGKQLLGRRPAIIAMLLMALAPLQVEFAQEARPYAIFSFVALLSMYYFWQFIQDHTKIKNLILLTAINVIGMYMHYDYFILIAAQVGIIILIHTVPYYKGDSSPLFKKAVFWWGLQGILFVPWFVYALIPNLTGVNYALSKGAPRIYSIFLEGDLWFNVVDVAESLQELLIFLGQTIAIITLGFGLYYFYIQLKREKKFSKETLAVFFLLAWYLASIAFYFISPLSAQYTPMWQRHIIIFSPPLFLLIGYGINKLPTVFTKFFAVGFIIASMLMPLIIVVKYDSHQTDRQAIKSFQYIEEHEKRGDFIFIPGRLWEVVALYNFQGQSPIGGFLPLKNFNSVTSRSNYYLPSIEEAIYAYKRPDKEAYVGLDELDKLVGSYKRVWLYFGFEAPQHLTWFIKNWNYIDCPEEYCPMIYLFENPNKD